MVYILTAIFSLKPHYTLLKNGKSICYFYTDTIFLILHVNNKFHAYTIDYCCYCLWIAGHRCYFFFNKIKHLREQQGKYMYFPTEYNSCMIWLIPYFQWTHLHTESLSFIVSSIIYYIMSKIEVREYVFFYLMQFSYESTHSIILRH